MLEFGQQIDVEYEVWRRGEKLQQQSAGRHGFEGMDLRTAQEYVEVYNKVWSGAEGPFFVVEVVSVRSEYGAA